MAHGKLIEIFRKVFNIFESMSNLNNGKMFQILETQFSLINVHILIPRHRNNKTARLIISCVSHLNSLSWEFMVIHYIAWNSNIRRFLQCVSICCKTLENARSYCCWSFSFCRFVIFWVDERTFYKFQYYWKLVYLLISFTLLHV